MASSVRICFVCLGNICRSPTAEGLMRHLVAEAGLEGAIEVESAGTGDWHVGERPDARAQETARERGFRLGGRARQFRREDFARFEYVVAMDRSNRDHLMKLAPDDEARRRIHLLLSFETGGTERDVPDPYFGGPGGFEDVFDICETACRRLLSELRKKHGL